MNSCFSLAVQLQSVRSIKARMKVALCSATKGGGAFYGSVFFDQVYLIITTVHSWDIFLKSYTNSDKSHMSLPHLISPTVTYLSWK